MDATIEVRVSQVFTPATPVREADLFAGRIEQLRKVVDVVNQHGQHAIVFGERGVGKTSLSNIIATKLATDVLSPRVTCDSTDTYQSLWKKVLAQIDLIKKQTTMGFQLSIFEETKKATDVVGDNPSTDDIRRLFSLLGTTSVVIVVIDEFDRIVEANTRRAVADTIKAFSDHAVPATIVLVGVADSVESLIAEHESIERCLVQIRMPRMSPNELHEVLITGAKKLGIHFDPHASSEIVALSQGLPHYTHLLALHSVRAAIDSGTKGDFVARAHVEIAIKKAVEDAQQSLRTAYRRAVMTPRKDSIYSQVLLACALAEPDEFGYFAAGDVREPLSQIMGRQYDIPGYAKHLNDFCSVGRGHVLQKTGEKHRFRFRFANPLMQPLVVMQGLVDKKIDASMVEELTAYRS
jgi:Cdc6-like AAA superfamily ATPase